MNMSNSFEVSNELGVPPAEPTVDCSACLQAPTPIERLEPPLESTHDYAEVMRGVVEGPRHVHRAAHVVRGYEVPKAQPVYCCFCGQRHFGGKKIETTCGLLVVVGKDCASRYLTGFESVNKVHRDRLAVQQDRERTKALLAELPDQIHRVQRDLESVLAFKQAAREHLPGLALVIGSRAERNAAKVHGAEHHLEALEVWKLSEFDFDEEFEFAREPVVEIGGPVEELPPIAASKAAKRLQSLRLQLQEIRRTLDRAPAFFSDANLAVMLFAAGSSRRLDVRNNRIVLHEERLSIGRGGCSPL